MTFANSGKKNEGHGLQPKPLGGDQVMIDSNVFQIGVPVKQTVPLIIKLRFAWANFWHAVGQARRIRALMDEAMQLKLLMREQELEIEDLKWRLNATARDLHNTKILARRGVK